MTASHRWGPLREYVEGPWLPWKENKVARLSVNVKVIIGDQETIGDRVETRRASPPVGGDLRQYIYLKNDTKPSFKRIEHFIDTPSSEEGMSASGYHSELKEVSDKVAEELAELYSLLLKR